MASAFWLRCQVIEGMIAASRARKGLENTGATAKAFDGEEVDW